jgi:hypothetical protein
MGRARRRLAFLRQVLWSQKDILVSLIGKNWQHVIDHSPTQIHMNVIDDGMTMIMMYDQMV